MLELSGVSVSLFGLAQAATEAGGKGGGPGGFLMPMVIIFGIMYFMMIRPQQRKEKERRLMINECKTGDRVIFSGGLMGTISNVKETTFVVKVGDGVKLEVLRGAVSKVLEKGEKPSEEDVKEGTK
jgi:preprotein translocase subunit YajC